MTGQQNFGYGQMEPEDTVTPYNVTDFHIRQKLALVRTAIPVKVLAVSGGGATATPATVAVQPLVNQLDGQGNAVPHGQVNGIPVLRLQAGGNAIVADPAVGDIGLMLCCDRDISSVKATGKQANPPSWRRHNFADGIYLGALFGAAPTGYVLLDQNGIKFVDANGNTIVLNASGISITDHNGNRITMGPAGINLTSIFGSQIQMLTGNIVNIVCTPTTGFTVNGVPVTVP
jgi:hypothetical protein